MTTKKAKKIWVIALSVFFFIIALIAGGALWGYSLLYSPNFEPSETVYIYLDEEPDFDRLCQELCDSAGVKQIDRFQLVAQFLKYPQAMRSGKYAVTPGMNNLTLLNNLRRGHQTVTHITFNNIRFVEDFAQKISAQMLFDEVELLSLLTDSAYCAGLGFTTETIKAMLIPNTYEVYWNLPADRFLQRMKREYDTFWSEQRRQQAEAIGLTPLQVATLASIVEEETALLAEYPIVAGLYMNRLNRGMLLQADPTVKYAVGDFMLQRILFKHLEVDSPYNTYIYPGLPPAPLRVPSIRAIDSVLNYTRHNYLYMVAKEDLSGGHNFAVTHAEHNRNANRYRAELNRRGIR